MPPINVSAMLALRENTGIPAPHLVIKALAGVGKTTTLVEGMKLLRGEKTSITPSDEQLAIWHQMQMSTECRHVCFCAFNRSIKEELEQRMPRGCYASTYHGLGSVVVHRNFKGVTLDQNRLQNIISRVLGKDIRDLRRKHSILVNSCISTVTYCKQNLIGLSDDTNWSDTLERVFSEEEIEVGDYSNELMGLVPAVLENCMNVQSDMSIDFTDMVWLPIALNLPISPYDLILMDEAQDANPCQQELILRYGKRVIVCGDPNQSIYGFAGADSNSMDNMLAKLKATKSGCNTLTLTVSRRCGKAIVKEAQGFVPEFKAHDSNPEGSVRTMRFSFTPTLGSYHSDVKPGDMVLCRNNAPLASQCLYFLSRGIPAKIQGRKIGENLISLIEKLSKKNGGSTKIVDFVAALDDWSFSEMEKERAKRIPSETKLQIIADKREALTYFTNELEYVDQLIQKISDIYTEAVTKKCILFSSIHQAKGLEANRVFLLLPKGPLHKSTSRSDNRNLGWVAVTRAINELVYVVRDE